MVSWQAKLTNFFLRIFLKRRIDPTEQPSRIRIKLDRFVQRWMGKLPIPIRVEPVDVDGIPAEWVRIDSNKPRRVLYYLHGGGYIIGSPDTHRPMISRIAARAEADAFVIDYRLAPENPFPAPVEDAIKGYRYLLDQGIDSKSIIIAGDSAGGGLTLATLLKIREIGLPQPAAAATLSPWTDMSASGWSILTNELVDPYLTPQGILLGARHYLQGESPTNPYASPVFADFANLPPVMIQVGDLEIIMDDSLRVADRIRAAGGTVRLDVWKGMPHVWQAFGYLPEAKLAIEQMGHFMREHAQPHMATSDQVSVSSSAAQ